MIHEEIVAREEATTMAELLIQLGVDRGDLVLVTDATHLLRSQTCFSRQGIEAVPRGTRYRATTWPSA